jgi:pimeloyl-[acyl-carrier protein] methyl ester esterase
MRLHVDVAGDGPPLVLLHGFAMHGGLFAPIVPALARSRRVHVVDLPGHGHAPHAFPWTLAALVEAVAEHVRSLRQPATLLGWSLGGLVALRLARAHPALAGALVLACTTPCFVARDGWPHAMDARTLARFGDELAASCKLTLQRFLTLQVQGSERGRESLAQLREALFARGAPSRETLAAALALLAGTDLRDEVADVAAPTLVITGGRDTLTPAAAGEWLARRMPDARHVDIAGAAHAPFLSHGEEFLAAVRGFLDARAHADLSRA